jgi:LacI family transcriptional regulator
MIAAQLGLNKSTVSRGLRNDPVLPPETRKRTQAMDRELGYRPNPLLSELAGYRWQMDHVTSGTVIGYIACRTPNPDTDGIFTDAFREEAAVLGYGVEVFHREDFKSSAKLQSVLRSRGITDLILGTVFHESQKTDLDWSKFVAVQLRSGFFSVPLHSVVRDHFNVVALAWQKAVERGYQRIGTVLFEHPLPIIDDALRRSAAYACQNYYFPHLPVIPPLVQRSFGAEAAKEFVSWAKANQPDVIIGFSGAHFFYFRDAFGHDVPYINLHNMLPSQLSGMPDDLGTYAREAINLVNFCRKSNQWGIPKQRIDHVIEPIWYEGNSLPKKATAPATTASTRR